MHLFSKTLTASAFLTFCVHFAYGQFSLDDFKGSASRTLIVMTETVNPDMIAKLHADHMDSLITEYQNEIQIYNETMKAVVEKIWTVNSKIIYMTPAEVDAAAKTKSDSTLVLYCATTTGSGLTPPKFTSDHGIMSWTYKEIKHGDLENTRVGINGLTMMMLKPIEHLDKSYLTCTYPFYRLLPNKLDIETAVKSLNLGLTEYLKGHTTKDEEATIKENQLHIKEKTLLFPRELMNPHLSASDVKSYYPFNYKVMSSDSIADYVSNNTTGYAYANVYIFQITSFGTNPVARKLQPSQALKEIMAIYDCETGEIMSYANSYSELRIGADALRELASKVKKT